MRDVMQENICEHHYFWFYFFSLEYSVYSKDYGISSIHISYCSYVFPIFSSE